MLPNPVLQARLFAYPDAARYRLGVNYQQLPTNAAKVPVYCPFERDGKMRFDGNYGSDPNYVNSSLQPTKFYPEVKGVSPQSLALHTEHEKWVGEVTSYTSHITDDDFVQPAALWDVIGREPGHQERVVENLAGSIREVKSPNLRNEVYGLFTALLEMREIILTCRQHCLVVLTRILALGLGRRLRLLSKSSASIGVLFGLVQIQANANST